MSPLLIAITFRMTARKGPGDRGQWSRLEVTDLIARPPAVYPQTPGKQRGMPRGDVPLVILSLAQAYLIPSFFAIYSIRSITRHEYPHSLSYQLTHLKKFAFSSMPAPASK